METDELSPRMERHRRFLEEYRQSHKAVYQVAHFYRYWGRGIFLPPIKMAPTPDQVYLFRDDFDLQLLYQGRTIGVGVKHLKDHVFHGPSGTPNGFRWPKGVIGAVDDVDDGMLEHVQQWCLVSADLSTMAVAYAASHPRWFIEPLTSKTGNTRDHYFLAVEHWEFYKLEAPAKMNDEDLQPMPKHA